MEKFSKNLTNSTNKIYDDAVVQLRDQFIIRGNLAYVWPIIIYIFLLYRFVSRKDFSGFSFKTQVLFWIVLFVRHVDLWTYLQYSWRIAVVFVLLTLSTITVLSFILYPRAEGLRHNIKMIYFKEVVKDDTFSLETLITIALMVFFGISLRHGSPADWIEYIATLKPIGIIFETIALLPQITCLLNSQACSSFFVFIYVIMLGYYYGFYIEADLNFILNNFVSPPEFFYYLDTRTPITLNRIPGLNSVIPFLCCFFYFMKVIRMFIKAMEAELEQPQQGLRRITVRPRDSISTIS